MITSAWIDTETTGIDTRDSSAFEIALLIYKGKECVYECLYNLNPLNDKIRWSEEAYSVNGVSEETILSYPPLEGVVPDIAADLKKHMPTEKYVFAGYNCGFDYGHVAALFARAGLNMDDLFNKKMIDVYQRVIMAAEKGILPKTKNQKLGTIAKELGIDPGNSHTAMDDIKTTRRIYEMLWFMENKQVKK